MDDKMITFDRPKLAGLKKAYERAVDDDAKSFQFEGKEFLTGYAKYLIEYLEANLQR